MCPDTSKPGQLSQVTNHFISWCCNSATRHFYTLWKEKYETNLHQTPSSCKRLLIRRFSPDCLQRQLLRHSPWAFWCPARRHFHASFGRKHVASPLPLHGVLETRQRLLTATYNIGVQCRIYNLRLESYLKKCNVRIMNCLHNFIFTTYLYHLIILETNSRQNCFASSMLPSLWAYVGIKSRRKQTCLAHGEDYSLPSGHSLPWQPLKHHNSASQKSDALDALD